MSLVAAWEDGVSVAVPPHLSDRVFRAHHCRDVPCTAVWNATQYGRGAPPQPVMHLGMTAGPPAPPVAIVTPLDVAPTTPLSPPPLPAPPRSPPLDPTPWPAPPSPHSMLSDVRGQKTAPAAADRRCDRAGTINRLPPEQPPPLPEEWYGELKPLHFEGHGDCLGLSNLDLTLATDLARLPPVPDPSVDAAANRIRAQLFALARQVGRQSEYVGISAFLLMALLKMRRPKMWVGSDLQDLLSIYAGELGNACQIPCSHDGVCVAIEQDAGMPR